MEESLVQRGNMIRVLGPIDLLTASGPQTVGGRRIRAVLATLVVSAGRAVPIDSLIEVVWPRRAPRSAVNTVQSHISRLRRLMGAETIRTVDHAYLLHVAPAEVDALRFEDLLGSAMAHRDDPAQCRLECNAALDLWRGLPFGDLADDEPFRLEALRLDELRLATMELRIEADLALGHADLVVGALESAVEEHPYRERLWLLLIEAMAADGRRVEALRTCGRLRRILGDVGLEGTEALRALEDRVAAGTCG